MCQSFWINVLKGLTTNVFLIGFHHLLRKFNCFVEDFCLSWCTKVVSAAALCNSLQELHWLHICCYCISIQVTVFQSIVLVTDFMNRFNSTLQMVQAAGETNRIQQGLFENYLESKVKDPYLFLVSYVWHWYTHCEILFIWPDLTRLNL